MKNIHNLTKNETTLLHGLSLNKKMRNVTIAQMRHTLKTLETYMLHGLKPISSALNWTVAEY